MNKIEHIKLNISPVNYIDIPNDSKILSVSNDDKDLILCIESNFSMVSIRKRKVYFLKEGDDTPESSKYIATIQIATDPFDGAELQHIYIED